MFAKPDINTDLLEKDPNGKWIVGPVVFRRNESNNAQLLGYISADNHIMKNGMPKEKILTEKEDAFQRYAVDLISDLLVPILRFYKIRSWRNNREDKEIV